MTINVAMLSNAKALNWTYGLYCRSRIDMCPSSLLEGCFGQINQCLAERLMRCMKAADQDNHWCYVEFLVQCNTQMHVASMHMLLTLAA